MNFLHVIDETTTMPSATIISAVICAVFTIITFSSCTIILIVYKIKRYRLDIIIIENEVRHIICIYNLKLFYLLCRRSSGKPNGLVMDITTSSSDYEEIHSIKSEKKLQNRDSKNIYEEITLGNLEAYKKCTSSDDSEIYI